MPLATAGQLTPQAPQLRESVTTLTSHPLAGPLSQLANPVLHCKPQSPAKQVCELFAARGQVVSQAPQLVGSVPRIVSHPLVGLPSQSPKPGLHAMLQVPEEQVGVPFTEEHTLPHAPQLFTSAERVAQFPEQVFSRLDMIGRSLSLL